MRKWALGILVLALAATAMPATADSHDFEFETEGQVRTRWDWVENYTDRSDNNDDSTNFFPFRANVGVRGSFSENFWGFVDLQAVGFFGDGNSGLQTYPQRSSGSFGDVSLYEAYVVWDTEGWDLKVGRAEHVLGNSLIMGNQSFYNGLNFDGLRASGEYDSFDIDVFLYEVLETGAPGTILPPGSADDDVYFFGVTADFMLGEMQLEPYIVHLKDNSAGAGAPVPPGLSPRSITTAGILWQQPTIDNDGWDINLELARQFGDAGPGAGVDAAGMLFEGWFGWTFGEGGRVHVGALWASGDDAGADNDAFQPMFEDGHINNRLGNLDLFNGALTGGTAMSNVQDINLGYTWGPSAESDHTFFAAVHQLSCAESSSNACITALGVGAVADDDVGLELDVSYAYQFAKNASFQAGLGWLSAGDAWGASPDDITRVWFQLEASWGKAKKWTHTGQQAALTR